MGIQLEKKTIKLLVCGPQLDGDQSESLFSYKEYHIDLCISHKCGTNIDDCDGQDIMKCCHCPTRNF